MDGSNFFCAGRSRKSRLRREPNPPSFSTLDLGYRCCDKKLILWTLPARNSECLKKKVHSSPLSSVEWGELFEFGRWPEITHFITEIPLRYARLNQLKRVFTHFDSKPLHDYPLSQNEPPQRLPPEFEKQSDHLVMEDQVNSTNISFSELYPAKLLNIQTIRAMRPKNGTSFSE
jgi:hypothetical protein